MQTQSPELTKNLFPLFRQTFLTPARPSPSRRGLNFLSKNDLPNHVSRRVLSGIFNKSLSSFAGLRNRSRTSLPRRNLPILSPRGQTRSARTRPRRPNTPLFSLSRRRRRRLSKSRGNKSASRRVRSSSASSRLRSSRGRSKRSSPPPPPPPLSARRRSRRARSRLTRRPPDRW